MEEIFRQGSLPLPVASTAIQSDLKLRRRYAFQPFLADFEESRFRHVHATALGNFITRQWNDELSRRFETASARTRVHARGRNRADFSHTHV